MVVIKGVVAAHHADYPPPTELQMSHYSISCILLKWAPALAPSRPDLTTLKCYRVYVNGEVEGMVCVCIHCTWYCVSPSNQSKRVMVSVR